MVSHRLAEERSLVLHRAIADRLAADPTVLDRARARVRRWLETGEVAPYWAHEWDAVLSRSIPEIRALLVDEGDHGRRFTTPTETTPKGSTRGARSPRGDGASG